MLQSENTPVIYYAVQRVLCQFIFCDEVGLRLLSAISGTSFVVVIFFLVRQQTDTRIALLAGILVLASPIHIYYSQEARVYSLLLLEIACFYLMQWKIVNGETRKVHIFLFGCLTVLMLHTHYFSILIIGTSFLVFGTCQVLKLRNISPWFFIILAVSGLTLLPWMAISVFSEQSSFEDLSWIQPFWDNEHSIGLIASTIQVFLTGPSRWNNILALKQFSNVTMPEQFYFISLGILYFFFLLLIFAVFHILKMGRARRQVAIELAAQFVLPLVALFLISHMLRPVYVVGRYDLIAYPAFIVFMMYAIWGLVTLEHKYRKINAILVGMFLSTMLVTQVAVGAIYFSEWPKQDHRARGHEISSLMSNGSTLVFLGPGSAVNLYYFILSGYTKAENYCVKKTGKIINCFMFPEEFDKAPGSTARYNRMINKNAESYEIGYILNQLRDNQIWLHVDQMTGTGKNYALNEVSYKFISKLKARGFVIQQAHLGLQLFKLERL